MAVEKLGSALININVEFDSTKAKTDLQTFLNAFEIGLQKAAASIGKTGLGDLFKMGEVQKQLDDVTNMTSALEIQFKRLAQAMGFGNIADELSLFKDQLTSINEVTDNNGKAIGRAVKSYLGLKTSIEETAARIHTLLDPTAKHYQQNLHINDLYREQSKLLESVAKVAYKMIGAAQVRVESGEAELDIIKQTLFYENARAAIRMQGKTEQRVLDSQTIPLPLNPVVTRRRSDEEIKALPLAEAEAFLATLDKTNLMFNKVSNHITDIKQNMLALAQAVNPSLSAFEEASKALEKYEQQSLNTIKEYQDKKTAIIDQARQDELSKDQAQLAITAAGLQNESEERQAFIRAHGNNLAAATEAKLKLVATTAEAITKLKEEKKTAEQLLKVYEGTVKVGTNTHVTDAIAIKNRQTLNDYPTAFQTATKQSKEANKALREDPEYKLFLAKQKADAEQLSADKVAIQQKEKADLAALEQEQRDEVKKSNEYKIVLLAKEEAAYKAAVAAKIAAGQIDKNTGKMVANTTFTPTATTSVGDQAKIDTEVTTRYNKELIEKSAARGAAIISDAKNFEVLRQKLIDFNNAVLLGNASQEKAGLASEELIRAHLKLAPALDTEAAAMRRVIDALNLVAGLQESLTDEQRAQISADLAIKYNEETLAIRRRTDALTDADKVKDINDSATAKGMDELQTVQQITAAHKERVRLIQLAAGGNTEKELALLAKEDEELKKQLKTRQDIVALNNRQDAASRGTPIAEDTAVTGAVREAQAAREFANAKFEGNAQARQVALDAIDEKLRQQIAKLINIKDLNIDILGKTSQLKDAQSFVPTGTDPTVEGEAQAQVAARSREVLRGEINAAEDRGLAAISASQGIAKETAALIDLRAAYASMKSNTAEKAKLLDLIDAEVRKKVGLKAALDTEAAARERHAQREAEINADSELDNIRKVQQRKESIETLEEETLAIRKRDNATTAADDVKAVVDNTAHLDRLRTEDQIKDRYRDQLAVLNASTAPVAAITMRRAELYQQLEKELATVREINKAVLDAHNLARGQAPRATSPITEAGRAAAVKRQDATSLISNPAELAETHRRINAELEEEIAKHLTINQLTEDKISGLLTISNIDALMPHVDAETLNIVNVLLGQMNAEVITKSAARGAAILDMSSKFRQALKNIEDIKNAQNDASGGVIPQADKDVAINKEIANTVGLSKEFQTVSDINETYRERAALINAEAKGHAETQRLLNANVAAHERAVIAYKEQENIILSMIDRSRKLLDIQKQNKLGGGRAGAAWEYENQSAAITATAGLSPEVQTLEREKAKKVLEDTFKQLLEIEKIDTRIAVQAGHLVYKESQLLNIIKERAAAMQQGAIVDGTGSADQVAAELEGNKRLKEAADRRFKELQADQQRRQGASGMSVGRVQAVARLEARAAGADLEQTRQSVEALTAAQRRHDEQNIRGLGTSQRITSATAQYRQTMGQLQSAENLGIYTTQQLARARTQAATTLRRETSLFGEYINAVTQGTSRIRQLAFTMADAGRTMMRTGAMMVTPFLPAIYKSAQFEQSVRQVTSVMGDLQGVLSQGAATDVLRADLLSLAETTKYTADNLAEASQKLALAGFSLQEVQAAIGSVANLAAATNSELTLSAETMVNITRAFGMSADASGDVGDILTAIVTNANTNLDSLAQAFKKVGPIAANLGQPIEGVAAALGVLANAGIKGSLAGTGLNRFFSELIQKSDKIEAKLKTVGSSFAAINPESVGLGEIIGELERLNKAGLLSTGDIFGMFEERSARAVITLINQGVGAFDELNEAAKGSAGSADRIAKQNLDTLSGDFLILKSNLDTLLITFGDVFNETTRDIVQMFTGVLQAVTEFIKSNQTLVTVIGKLVLVVGSAKIALGALIFLSGSFMKIMAGSSVISASLTFLQARLWGIPPAAAAAAASTRSFGIANRIAELQIRAAGRGMDATAAAAIRGRAAVMGFWATLGPLLLILGLLVLAIAAVTGIWALWTASIETSRTKTLDQFKGSLEAADKAIISHTEKIKNMRKEYELYQKLGSLNEVQFKELTKKGSSIYEMDPANRAAKNAEFDAQIDASLGAAGEANERNFAMFSGRDYWGKVHNESPHERDGKGRPIRLGSTAQADVRKRLYFNNDDEIMDRSYFRRDEKLDMSSILKDSLTKEQLENAIAANALKKEYNELMDSMVAYQDVLRGGGVAIATEIINEEQKAKLIQNQIDLLNQKAKINESVEETDKLKEEVKLEQELLEKSKQRIEALKGSFKENEKITQKRLELIDINERLFDQEAARDALTEAIAARGGAATRSEAAQLRYIEKQLKKIGDERDIHVEKTNKLIEVDKKLLEISERRLANEKELTKLKEKIEKENRDDKLTDREKVALSTKEDRDDAIGKNKYSLQAEIDKINAKKGLAAGGDIRDLSPEELTELADSKDIGKASLAVVDDAKNYLQTDDRIADHRKTGSAASNVLMTSELELNALKARLNSTTTPLTTEERIKVVTDIADKEAFIKVAEDTIKTEKEAIDKIVAGRQQAKDNVGKSMADLNILEAGYAEKIKRDEDAYDKKQSLAIDNQKLDDQIAQAELDNNEALILQLKRQKAFEAIDKKADEDFKKGDVRENEKAAQVAAQKAAYDAKAKEEATKKALTDSQNLRKIRKEFLKQELSDAKLDKDTHKEDKIAKQISDMDIQDQADSIFGTPEELAIKLKNNAFAANALIAQKKDYIDRQKELFDKETAANRAKKTEDDKNSAVKDMEKRREDAQKKRLDNEKSITEALLKQANSVRDIINVYRFLMAQEALRASAGNKNRLLALNTEDKLLKMRAKGVTSGRAYARQVSNLGKYSADAMKFGESQSSVARQIALSASLNTGLNSPAPKPASNPFADMFSGVASFFGGGPNFNGKQNLPGSGSQRGAAATTINNNQKTVNVEAGAVVINGVNDTDLLDVIQNSIQKIFQDAI